MAADVIKWRRTRRGERGTACGATEGGADVPAAPINGADESEVAEVRAVIIEVDVERWVALFRRFRVCGERALRVHVLNVLQPSTHLRQVGQKNDPSFLKSKCNGNPRSSRKSTCNGKCSPLVPETLSHAA